MRQSYVKGNPYHAKDGLDSFFYIFNEHGRLKDSYLTISNLRTMLSMDTRSDILVWDKVGEFTNDELRMADIEWPGGKTNPPVDTADKFHLKIVTLNEPPFIIVSDVDPDTGSCPGSGGSICFWDVQQHQQDVVHINRTLNKCCSGYCIDLLEKLANDIGFTYTLYKFKVENLWDLDRTEIDVQDESVEDTEKAMVLVEQSIKRLKDEH
ncbi:unnamed protein product, partial [Gongylonema pulchrum]|uniref:Lig_chan-Glu_bd domain-containing protein n=1 Tax=Gongylonema pulchrum TaxID=637853 RepID=A0A183E1V7_9BILA